MFLSTWLENLLSTMISFIDNQKKIKDLVDKHNKIS